MCLRFSSAASMFQAVKVFKNISSFARYVRFTCIFLNSF